MRPIAVAKTQEEYTLAVEELESSEVWEEHEAFQTWFKKYWLSHSQVTLCKTCEKLLCILFQYMVPFMYRANNFIQVLFRIFLTTVYLYTEVSYHCDHCIDPVKGCCIIFFFVMLTNKT